MKEKIKKEIQRRMENCECEEVSLAYSGLIEFIDNPALEETHKEFDAWRKVYHK